MVFARFSKSSTSTSILGGACQTFVGPLLLLSSLGDDVGELSFSFSFPFSVSFCLKGEEEMFSLREGDLFFLLLR